MNERCPLCGDGSHSTYNFFGIEMLQCPERGEDRHILAKDLDEDLVSGLRPLWYWQPYDPVTRELLDWNLPGTLVHDRYYETHEVSRHEADRAWLDINMSVVRTIKNRTMRDDWFRATEVKYLSIRRLGWGAWYAGKLRKLLSRA